MRLKIHYFLYILFDFIAAFLALVFFNNYSTNNLSTFQFNIFQLLIVSFIWISLYTFTGAYFQIVRKSRIKELFSFTGISILGVLIIFFLYILDNKEIHDYHTYYQQIIRYFFIHWSIGVFFKMVVMSQTKSAIKNGKIYFNTLVIGSGKSAYDIVNELNINNQFLGFRFVAYIKTALSNEDFFFGTIRNMGGVENIEKIIRRCKIEHIVIALEPNEKELISDLLYKIEGYPVRISILPDIYQMLIGTVTVNHFLGVPLIEINQKIMPLWQQAIKRGMDIIISSLVLIMGAPFFLFFGIMTKLTSKGPIFYLQERIGKHGIPFNIIKFRSMFVDAESAGPSLSKDNDPRVTKWGKFMRKTRIDEMPQFYNVLIGEMSLVGPRPERQYFINQITQISPYYKHLQKVRPGITSLGQIKYGYAENVDQMVQRLRFDIIYIENMSIVMDIRILIFTFLTVIKARGK